MPLLTKPSSYSNWTGTTPANSVEPSNSIKGTGWVPNQKPPSQTMNWLQYNNDQWIKYLVSATDATLGLLGIYDAYVGVTSPLAQYATINAALSSAGFPTNGGRILVLDSLALASIQTISYPNTEITIKPGVTLSASGATTAIQVSASGVRIKGGRIAGFSGNGILVDAGSNYTMIGEIRFSGNTNDITDNNGNTATYAIINE